MKYKLLTLAVSAGLLVACGSDNDNRVEAENFSSVQAFDGAVRYLDVGIKCATETDYTGFGETGGEGKILLGEGNFPLFDEDPTQCSFLFAERLQVGTRDAIDESNGKLMTAVEYRVPGALITAGEPIAGTPFSTLIEAKLEEAGEGADLDAIINDAFASTLPDGVTLTAEQQSLFLRDPQQLLDDLESDEETRTGLLATTMVLSDAITATNTGNGPDITTVESATKSAATDLASNPGFPTNDDGDPTYVDLSSDFSDYYEAVETNPDTPPPSAPTDPDDLTPGEELPPEDPGELPPTGGSGSTG